MRIFKNKLSAGQREALKRLADGIECGAKLRPQGFTELFPITSSSKYASCALGAAWECKLIGQGLELTPSIIDQSENTLCHCQILESYGVTTKAQIIDVEIDGESIAFDSDEIDDVIIRLNDSRRWTREQIAAFLREVY